MSQVPGAVGLVLRKFFYRSLFKKVGTNVIFGKNLTIRYPHKISIGNNVIIDDNCLLDAKGKENNGIVIEDNVIIVPSTFPVNSKFPIAIKSVACFSLVSCVNKGYFVKSINQNHLLIFLILLMFQYNNKYLCYNLFVFQN